MANARLVYQSRVRGCLLGGAIGDALGAPIEFDSTLRIRQRYGTAGITSLVPDNSGHLGLITDDTQMTLFTAEALIRANVRAHSVSGELGGGDSRTGYGDDREGWLGLGGDEADIVHRAYLRWLDTQQYPGPPPQDDGIRNGWLRRQHWLYSRRAPGNACLSGLSHRRFRGAAPEFGCPGPVNSGSKGCGTVIRSAPFGLAAETPRHAFELAAECAQITHGHPTGYIAAGALAALVNVLRQGLPLREAVEATLDLLVTYPAHEETANALQSAIALAGRGDPTPEKIESLGGAWIAEEALAISVYCALVAGQPEEMRRALLLAVNHSGDSDSTGAICGNILGALHGDQALPADWLVPLEGRAVITELADDFAIEFSGPDVKDLWGAKYPGD
ncbi:ADP-ribosylglycohydrolase family protein [Sinosporangium siamense]|uniref:ADP-ribosylglycohydrolase n=1 Tax=Sinosporangium siamense TaxID=1367973 RepID=A0A919RLD8_9ACTN|nr:ADP-ribosylglycohydrolase family protein [Sinosporangium siamense]GII95723.1 hypothetical protein Ssi02_59540 [Sinosporangium siamense]